MKLLFKTIEITNLLSYGNKPTVIDFTSGLNLITGKNGTGKSSSLLDALSFALYDKPYRNVNKDKLINRKNKKNLKVDCLFGVNGVEHRIVRGMKNKDVDLEFWIDGVKQEILSTKSLMQSEVEKIIGIDYKLFKQIISLSINHNTPFLTLPSKDKRELLEKFFSIDVISSMLKVAKDGLKGVKIKRDLIQNSINILKNVLLTEKDRIKSFEESKKTFDDDKTKELEQLSLNITDLEKKLKLLKKEGISKKKELDTISYTDISVVRNKKDSLSKDKNVLEIEIVNANKIITALNKFDICPTCKSELTTEHKNEELEIQNKIISDSTKSIIDLNLNIEEFNLEIKNIEKIMSEERELKFELKELKNNYSSIENQIEKLKKDEQKIVDRVFVVDILSLKNEYKQKKTEYQNNVSEFDTLDEDIKNYTHVVDLLSDTGIKSYIFEQLVPVLNKSVNYYLNMFELPVVIEFDNTMNDSIRSMTDFNASVDYMSFSEGEKKRIDMAILLSFIDVVKKVSNWNCNVLIVDELLDSSIDDEGLEKLLESMEKMTIDGDDIGVYIISHRLKMEYKHFFTKMLQITKSSDGFSKIEILE